MPKTSHSKFKNVMLDLISGIDINLLSLHDNSKTFLGIVGNDLRLLKLKYINFDSLEK